MKELIEAVKILAGEELKRGYEKNGPHTSRHQAEGVLREELEETRKELDVLGYQLKIVWDDIKGNKENLRAIDEMLKGALCLAAESIQVAAMVQKFIDFEKNKKVLDELKINIGEAANKAIIKAVEESLKQIKAEEPQKQTINPQIKGLYTCKYIEDISIEIDEVGRKNIKFRCPKKEAGIKDLELYPPFGWKDGFTFCPEDSYINGAAVCFRIEEEKKGDKR